MKKTSLGILCLILCGHQLAVGALNETQLNDFSAVLASPDPHTRMAAVEQLTTRALTEGDNRVLPIFVIALGDADFKVRRSAAAGLQALAFNSNPKMFASPPMPIDFRQSPATQSALQAAITDPVLEVRQSALGAYLLFFPISAELQDSLADRFDTEGKNPTFQNVILLALTMDGVPTTKAVTLLNRLVAAPATTAIIAQVVLDSATPPSALLPKLGDQILLIQGADRRAALARAIARYGAQAKPYLSRLVAAGNSESDASARQSIQSAVQTITNAR